MKKAPYDDIIGLPHHVSTVHPQMPSGARAAQFSAFAALVGFGDIIDETARQTVPKRELDESEKAELDRKIAVLASKIAEKPAATVEFFVPDEWKDGGEYLLKTDAVVRISPARKTLTFADGTKIRFEDIAGIEFGNATGRTEPE